jgi:hypothetical protein
MTEPRGGEAMTTGGVFDVSHCRTALRAVLVSIIVEMPVARFALRTIVEEQVVDFTVTIAEVKIL